MEKYNPLSSVFYLRKTDDMAKCYTRVDFWASILAALLIVLSLVLSRYSNVTFSQLWKLTNGNWALAFCSIVSMIIVLYVVVVNFLFRNNSILSTINICLGLLMLALAVMECMVLKNGIFLDGETWAMSNDPAIGFYCLIVAGVLVVALEFYKLGVQGYYSRDDVIQEKQGSGVEIVDGVVMIDGEKVDLDSNNQNDTRIRVLTEEEQAESQEKSLEEADKKE